MNLRQLEIFGAVMSTGTTVGAANLLHISQPAVSNMIIHMENQFKFKLFYRQRGRLVPTDEATLLHHRAQKVFEAFDATLFAVDQIKGALIGELRIVCTPALGNTLIPLAVARFGENRPQVKVSIETGSMEYVYNTIERGKADLGVHFSPRAHPLIERESLGDLSLICALPKEHPLAKKAVIEPLDLVDYPFISLSPNDPLGAVIENAFLQAGVQPERAIEIRYINNACELVALGRGVALVDSYLLLKPGRYPELTFRAFRPQIVTQTSVIHLKSRSLGAIPQLFLEDLREVFKNVEDHEAGRVHYEPTVVASEQSRS